MVEISKSGSGEGPGHKGRGYSTYRRLRATGHDEDRGQFRWICLGELAPKPWTVIVA